MIAIQANEQGHPIVVEVVNGETRTVDAERWTEILSEELIVDSDQRLIVPIGIKTDDFVENGQNNPDR